MATVPPVGSGLLGAVRGTLHDHWKWFAAEGVLLIVLGLIAVFLPAAASITVTLVIGWVLLISGIVGLISTVRARHAPGLAWSLLSAITGMAAGVLLLVWPLAGTLSLTAVLIAFLCVEGVVSIFYALDHRRGLSGRWGWMLASGVVDLLLAVVILSGLPASALWALGLIIGINLLFGGWALLMMALHARRLAA